MAKFDRIKGKLNLLKFKKQNIGLLNFFASVCNKEKKSNDCRNTIFF